MNNRAARFILALALLLVSTLCSEGQPSTTASGQQVIFVCEHGSVKSLMAASHFNRLAEARGISVRAISRGVEPDAAVPPKIATALGADGFDVAVYKPLALKPEEAASAFKVVSIGADLSSLLAGTEVTLERWDEIPPASVDYAKSREALMKRLEALLSELGKP